MNIFKKVALGLLSFLLFFSLTIFGLAFMLNNTILNPDFVTSELDNLDMSSLTREIVSERNPEEKQSKEIMDAMVNNTTKVEPLVKEQASAAINSIYDYLLGESESLDLALTLKNTILSSDFITALVDELDIPSLAAQHIRQRLPDAILMEGYRIEDIDKHLDDAISEQGAWLNQQVVTTADPIIDYLLGKSRGLSIVVSLEPVKNSLRDKIWAAFQQAPPPELATIPRTRWEPYFNKFYPEFARGIPDTLELDQSLLGTEIPRGIAKALSEAEDRIGQARHYISYFQLGYKLLIGFMVLLILGIILTNRRVKGITRRLGITFLTYGIFEYAGIFIAKYFAERDILSSEIASSTFQTWRLHFIDTLLAPLEMFSLGLLISGAVLIIVSFVYKPHHPES